MLKAVFVGNPVDYSLNFNCEKLLSEECQSRLSSLNFNIRSIKTHFEEFEASLLCANLKPVIISFTETWLREEKEAELYRLKGYQKLIACNRSWGPRGGVGIMLQEGIKFKVILKDTVREWLVVETTSPFNLIIIVTYRCEKKYSRNEYCEWLLETLLTLNKTHKDVVIMGDFNIDLLVETKHSRELLDIMKTFNLKLVSPLDVTREQGTSRTCLDHIYSDLPIRHKSVIRSTITDHYFVWVEFEKPIFVEKPSRTYRNFGNLTKNDNMCKFLFLLNHRLSNFDWDSIGLNEGFQEIINCLNSVIDRYAPLKPMRFNRQSWIDNKVKREITKREKFHREWTRDPSNVVKKTKYIRQRNATKTLIRCKKKGHVQKSFDDCKDMKRFHQQLNTIIGKNQTPVLPHFNENQNIEAFNEYFTQVGPRMEKTIQPQPYQSIIETQEQSMFLGPVNQVEVERTICNLLNKTSTGSDGISNKVIKLASPAVVPCLIKLFNRCLKAEYFPLVLKVAKVIPIYKQGDSNEFENYRPIALLPPIAKVFERLLYDKMMSYIQKYKLINAKQFGFRRKHKTVDAIASVIEEIRSFLDKKIPSCCVFFDLKKAFDTINHTILLEKLDNYGFRGPIKNLLRSYLSNRTQYVQVGAQISSPLDTECGVPQGSVLGPLLFILYVNDLPLCAESNFTLFADDTTVLEKIPSFDLTTIIGTIENVDSWMKENKLKCNVDKSKAVVFGNNLPSELSFGVHNILIKPQLKYLGVVIDEKLTFSDHCAKVKNRLLFCNYTVLRARNFLTRSQLLSYYKTHVNPIVQYGVLIYGCTSYSNLDPVLKIQKRIVRSICFLPKYASVHQFMVENELPTVYEFHIYELLKTIIGCVRSEHVHDTKDCYLKFSDVGFGLRSITRREVHVPFAKTKKLNHSLCKRVPELYNKLVKVSMLPDCNLIRSMSDEVVRHYRHNFLRNFILGNRDLVDFVFDKKKLT